MEAAGAVLCVKSIGAYKFCHPCDVTSARVAKFTADEDSNMIAAINDPVGDVPRELQPVEKLSDPNHLQKLLYKALVDLRAAKHWSGGVLSKAVIEYFNKLYRYVIKSVAVIEDLPGFETEDEKADWIHGALLNIDLISSDCISNVWDMTLNDYSSLSRDASVTRPPNEEHRGEIPTWEAREQRGGRKPLKRRVVVITGAASGLGRALCHALAYEECSVALLDMDLEGLKHTHEKLLECYPDIMATIHLLDVRDEAAWAPVAEDVLSRHGAVHMLINNAGVEDAAESAFDTELDLHRFRQTMEINFWSALHGTLAFADIISKHCKKGGYIVNIAAEGSQASRQSLSVPYVVSKAALSAFTLAITAGKLLPHNMKTLDVKPGRFQSLAKSTTQRIFKVDEEAPSGLEDAVAARALRVAEASHGAMSADRVARAIIRAIKKGKHSLAFHEPVLTLSFSAWPPRVWPIQSRSAHLQARGKKQMLWTQMRKLVSSCAGSSRKKKRKARAYNLIRQRKARAYNLIRQRKARKYHR
ncbi:hypothetical protein CYMTET_7720 [Cymbomonas tetramitiformis]|uniref:Mutator-like transposase domain-containing protein n=1 Tax=Cymbomonas tetramitiformis TaxID=36881 RepID=A0AAE0LGT5_9CHLO|nr:hypothetical protein CYMTET_7720 [Cymbomonas tetramitiformis]